MCDIWFTRHNNANQGGYAQFMPVQATDDGLADTVTEQGRDRFYIMRLPGVDKDHSIIKKLFSINYGIDPAEDAPMIARRIWLLRGADLPLAARQTLQQTGMITIKAGDYQGEYDYTWNQVKNYFRDTLLNVDGPGDL